MNSVFKLLVQFNKNFAQKKQYWMEFIQIVEKNCQMNITTRNY